MSILNVYVKKEGKTTWIEMDTFPLIYTTLPTKIKYLRLPLYLSICYNSKIFFFVITLKSTKISLLLAF